DAANPRHVALEQRNVTLIDFSGEGAPPPQTGELQLEPIRIERPPKRHELILGSAAHEGRNHFEQSNGRGRRMPSPARKHPQEIHRSFTWVWPCTCVRLMVLTATARRATQKKENWYAVG